MAGADEDMGLTNCLLLCGLNVLCDLCDLGREVILVAVSLLQHESVRCGELRKELRGARLRPGRLTCSEAAAATWRAVLATGRAPRGERRGRGRWRAGIGPVCGPREQETDLSRCRRRPFDFSMLPAHLLLAAWAPRGARADAALAVPAPASSMRAAAGRCPWCLFKALLGLSEPGPL